MLNDSVYSSDEFDDDVVDADAFGGGCVCRAMGQTAAVTNDGTAHTHQADLFRHQWSPRLPDGSFWAQTVRSFS